MKVRTLLHVVAASSALSSTQAAESNSGTVTKTEKVAEVTRGDLQVEKLVRKNSKPMISWDLTVKETLKEIITFGEDGKLTPKIDLQATVTVLGTGVTSGSGSSYTSYTTAGKLKFGDNSWVTVHNGNEDAVTPGKVVYQTVAKQGEPIRFQAAYYYNGWKDFRHESSDEVLTLTDGDTIPSNKPENEAVASAEDYLKPHLDANGKISIGDYDVIYVAELTHTDKNAGGYDLQDLIILVSFSNVTSE
ncbi:hypothetical protein [Rubritalea tangerina]|uniref:Uncharacterized protein n=1 Tax=Rubritalea tangerina TaxID=430798 RepID=A0ABW4ZEJ3_9BACT